ncbi:hypothetical protein DAT35_42125 [Vitiosangium sp. GDMCC 1.1324]|nr:hypothetical protein DAT35_42125 [Vitiosangium sp. GDMCC 1.1324]
MALGAAMALGIWGLAMVGGCDTTVPGQDGPMDARTANLGAVLEPIPGEPTTAVDSGTVPWRGECTADSDCDPAAASLCGDNTEMYCKFPKLKDGGQATKGTCECRERTPKPIEHDGGVIDAGVIIVSD